MKKLLENKYNMYLSLKDFFLSRVAAFTSLSHFTDYYNLFLTSLEEIHQLSEELTALQSNTTNSKSALKKELEVLVVDSAKKIYAYANYLRNDALINQALYIKQNAGKASNTKLPEYGNTIYNLAQASLTELAPYLITTASQALLRKAIDDFNIANPSNKTTKNQLHTLRVQLEDQFKMAGKAVNDIGILVDSIEHNNPALYAAYQSAIKIYNYGRRSYDISGQINNAEDKEGLKGVSVTVMNKDTNEIVLEKKTAAKGGWRGDVPSNGVYVFTFNKAGYKVLPLTRAVTKGERCVIKAKLIPEVYNNQE
jgi:hypothetical protein